MGLTGQSIVAAAFAGAALMAGSIPAVAQTTLIMSDVLPESNFMVENANRFAEEVRTATNGEINIEVRAGGSLGFNGPDQLAAVRDGLVQMADINISQQVGVDPLFGVEGVPFLIGSMEELERYHQFVRPVFEELALEHNQKILYMVPSPAQYVYLNVLIEDLEDFRGIPVRGADKNTVDIVSALGMAGVAMPWGELIPALASGRVEGVATSATSGVDGKFWEFLDYIYPTNHTWGSNMVTINLDAWNQLTPERQGAIEETAARLEPEFWEVSRQGDVESIEIMTKNGMEFVPVSDDLRAAMTERAQQLQAAFVQRIPEAGEIIEQYKASQ